MGDNYTISEWQNFKPKVDDVKPKVDDVKKTESEKEKNNNDNKKIIPPKYRNKKCFNCF